MNIPAYSLGAECDAWTIMNDWGDAEPWHMWDALQAYMQLVPMTAEVKWD